MRRSVLVCIGTMAAVFFLAILFHGIGGREDIVRYHQHLEQPSEAELGVCPVCGGDGELCTHLPILKIETGGQKVPGRAIPTKENTLAGYETGPNGETEVLVHISTIEQQGVWHHPEDAHSLEGAAMFRVRGNSSRWFAKSSYRIRLVDMENPEEEIRLPLLGMQKGNEWALHGPFLDKTLMRNYMWMNLSAEIMGYAPNVRFCEVLLDGEYQGVYLLMETIAVSVQEGRINLSEFQEGDRICSYLARIEPHTNPEKEVDNFTFYTNRMEPNTRVELIYPGLRLRNQQVEEYVKTDLSEIEKSLFSLDVIKGSGTYRDNINMGSFADYYIIMEFLGINDAFSASTYYHRDVRGKLTAGPVWDFNNALDCFLRSMPVDSFLLSQRGWFSQLMRDPNFVEMVISRYRTLRRGILSEDYLLEYIDQVQDWLGSAIDRNYEVWGYTFDPTKVTSHERKAPDKASGHTIQDVNPSSYEEAVNWMESYMVSRGRWMDQYIDSLRQYCHTSKNALWNLD